MAPEPAAPALAPAPTPVGWKQIVIFVLVLPLAFLFGRAWILDAQGGVLACTRADNRCEIENGWLLRARIRFPAEELQGAKITTTTVSMGRKIHGVNLLTKSGKYTLGGGDVDDAPGIVAAIDAFARDSHAPSLDVRVPADTVRYGIVAFLALIYGFMGLALAVGWVRGRKRSTA